ncbi:MAG: N-acetylmuramic acid 6-phosphate etherase [Aestuariivirga sp.]|uniref:N-acetylmuramic acid 6-phosphate etherase n=1 Tax=Aestuariivirga sp. TaxID=2650926 RepID=UPI0025BC57CF|nr:N-acetylmuramic acid 6-phosphate etherase [Aestuariivirga sp.]MCA3561131.1 N-acetylmuramic acid 6-phosphate etherase [Aestuariivirga sp.]
MAERPTEQSGSYAGIDTWPDARILEALAEGQARAIAAVRQAAPAIAGAATILAQRLAAGGRLAYAGAGASIRVAVQDGSELPATFGMPKSKLLYLIAGGRAAMFDTLADAEDDEADGAAQADILTPADTMIAVAASGSTPFTVAAANRAREKGAFVIAVVNNPGSKLAATADLEILLASGPEVIAGSTRLGAGTAQKAALNLLSTLTYIKLGAVHDGLMVNVETGNAKLRRRAAGIVATIARVDEARAAVALETAGGHVKPAVLLCAGANDIAAAQRLLDAANGNLRLAMSHIRDT